MKKKLNWLFFVLLVAFIPAITSCEEDFKEEIPPEEEPEAPQDSIVVVAPEEIEAMLSVGYTKSNVAVVCELSGDNFVDNTAPNDRGETFDLESRDPMDDYLFAWEDVLNNEHQDSPMYIWKECYEAIAQANKALACIADYETIGKGKEVSDYKGEALLIRAYHHFVLANIFCQAYRGEDKSKSLPGIPYATENEDELPVNTDRGSLADTYAKIEADLLEGLSLINDRIYDRPKYRFNLQAATAFAARFYLYKRDYEKVVAYANMALGTSGIPSGFNDVWAHNFESLVDVNAYYAGEERQSNFLILRTYSNYSRLHGKRYTINGDGAYATYLSALPTLEKYTTFHPCYLGKLYISGSQEYGCFFAGIYETFEYVDEEAHTGYPVIVRPEFTLEETILTRAEAKFYIGDIAGGVEDLKAWDDARHNLPDSYSDYNSILLDLTSERIMEFYRDNDPGHGIVKKLNIDDVCPTARYSVSEAIEPYLQCALHFRRIQNIGDGSRWFDIKRYGLEITHAIGTSRVETLTWNDSRRAIQIPTKALLAGIEPNNR